MSLLFATVLVGCSTVTAGPSTAPPASPNAPSGASSTFGHIHDVAIDDRAGIVYIATHEGLFSVPTATSAPKDAAALGGPLAGLRHDFMSFTMDGARMYASGHPDPAASSHKNLGLLASEDFGQSWGALSLDGITDFHSLEVSQSSPGETTIYGHDSADSVIRVSRDAGSTWAVGATLPMRDFAADPARTGTVYATTRNGVEVSRDYARSFEISPDAPALYLITSAGSALEPQLFGIDVAGTVWRKSADAPWVSTGAVTGTADALAVSGGATPMLVVADERGVVISSDLGSRWRVLVTG